MNQKPKKAIQLANLSKFNTNEFSFFKLQFCALNKVLKSSAKLFKQR